MKHLLVPTDFSECAGYALDAAIRLARKLDLTIHLLTCVDFPVKGNSLSEKHRDAFPEIQQMISTGNKVFENTRGKYPELNITRSIANGNLLDEIKSCIREKGIDMLVMGSHGRSGFNELFIGSNTQKVVRVIHRPVLVVKKAIPDINFERIVFASSFNQSEKEDFLKFKQLIAPFEPTIFLLAIKTSFFFDAPVAAIRSAMEDFKRMAVPFPCKIFIVKNPDIDSGIRSFAEEINADLICISNVHRHKIKRILTGSNVEMLINHSRLPVLSIDFEDS